ncbi:hypothetical protein GT370_11540 [Acidocella sp. MX-AZ03]|uniref:hypothetical protein n=1 Tax=Acidocella sp. MX-AZ03 TaxID=2697363 RepID=UPI0022DE584E|nr:hypothetical protein [Acidocella sp. MX-AZ03]WBO57921.1 hypothetical protein GT370_11540 [Acidocella sp. MX-AZ03]
MTKPESTKKNSTAAIGGREKPKGMALVPLRVASPARWSVATQKAAMNRAISRVRKRFAARCMDLALGGALRRVKRGAVAQHGLRGGGDAGFIVQR